MLTVDKTPAYNLVMTEGPHQDRLPTTGLVQVPKGDNSEEACFPRILREPEHVSVSNGAFSEHGWQGFLLLFLYTQHVLLIEGRSIAESLSRRGW